VVLYAGSAVNFGNHGYERWATRPMDFLVGTGLVLIFVLLSWAYGRVLSGGRPLNPFKRRIFIYASLFALMGLWAVTVGLVGWLHYRRERARRESEHNSEARSS
jgi:hypothetical protein